MDLEQFYSADERRRHSEELEFGREWTDDRGRSEISWVADTGEIYAMREPPGEVVGDFIGDTIVRGSNQQLEIEILGVVPGRDAIGSVMNGWEDAMRADNSLAWVRERVANAANEMGEPPAQPSKDFPAN